MKKLFTILFYLYFSYSAMAQEYVFILVDVSKTVKQSDLIAAKQALTDVLLGNKLSNSSVSGGQIQDLLPFKIMIGDKLSILKFGDQKTTLNISPQPIIVHDIPLDIYNIINSFPTFPTDNNTYWKLAKAKIAKYAKMNGIKSYKIYIISDENEDNFGPRGMPNYIDPPTLELAESYNTITNPAIEEPSILVKIQTTTQGFKLNFCPKVDVSNYAIPGDSDGDGVPDISDKCPGTLPGTKVNSDGCPDSIAPSPSITLTAFADGKKDKPKPTKYSSFYISWTCNCPVGTKFNILLLQIEGGNFKDRKANLTTNSAKFTDVPSGKFKIVVSALNANSAITFVETPTSSFGLILLLMLLLIAAIISYKIWNDKRKKKPIKSVDDKAKEIFVPNNTSSPQSTNSKHY